MLKFLGQHELALSKPLLVVHEFLFAHQRGLQFGSHGIKSLPPPLPDRAPRGELNRRFGSNTHASNGGMRWKPALCKIAHSDDNLMKAIWPLAFAKAQCWQLLLRSRQLNRVLRKM